MESEKKPSIFSDRGFIGSAGELDEYGVWVKSEPEDISFDNNAFFDDIGSEAEVKDGPDAFSFGFDVDAAQLDLSKPSDRVSLEKSLDTADEPEAETFDMDFGIDEPAEQASELHADKQTASTAVGEPELETFDMDFDIDEPAEQASELHADKQTASTAAADEPEAEIFDIDFDIDDPAEQASELHADKQTASPEAVGEPELETFDMDFDIDEPVEQASELHADKQTASTAVGEPALETFDMDFDIDEPAEQASELHADKQAASTEAVGEPELETFDMNFDIDEPAEQASELHADKQTASTEAAENAALPQVDARSTELLLKIVDELATIKTELSRLKDEISNIRENAVPADFKIDNKADADDESETLSSEELAAVIKNSSIELKEPEDITGKPSSVLDTEFLQMEDTAPQSDEAEHPAESTAEDSAEPPELSVDLDLSGEDVFLDAPPFGTEADAAFSEIIEDNIVVPSLPQDEAYTADYLSPDERPAVIADDGAVLNEIEPPAELEPEPAAPQSSEIASEPVAPPPKPSKSSTARAVPQSEPPEKPSKENESSHAPVVPQSEIHEQTAAPIAGQTAPQAAGQDITDSQQFKKELQVVLSYMDRLLESLPDEKIEEFARSKQFDVYKKVFKDLGLA
jgi:uncharacterized protein involved in high-affinity Fe2+ transport